MNTNMSNLCRIRRSSCCSVLYIILWIVEFDDDVYNLNLLPVGGRSYIMYYVGM